MDNKGCKADMFSGSLSKNHSIIQISTHITQGNVIQDTR